MYFKGYAAEKIGVGEIKVYLRRRQPKFVLAKAWEEGVDVDYVSCWIRIEGDDTISIASDTL